MTTAQVQTENADIVYDYEGSGPLLLMIAGRGGAGERYAGISEILKDEYTVVRYDRRCCARSTGDKERPLDMTQQARDALAVISDLGEHTAYIFGSSSGASVALRIAEYYPESALGIIAHEPMAISVLPDAGSWSEFNMKLDEVYHAQGVGPAMKLLSGSMVGFPAPNAGARQVPAGRPGDDGMDFFFGSEFMSVCFYRPDLQRIKRNKTKLTLTKGRLSLDAYYARTADVISEQLERPLHVMSGNHIACVTNPATFAAELRPLLKELRGDQPNQRGIPR